MNATKHMLWGANRTIPSYIQGDQTGRILASWATFYFGLLLTLGDFLLWATFYFGRLFTLGDFLLWATFYFGRLFTLGYCLLCAFFYNNRS
jgi:hypothetical protein